MTSNEFLSISMNLVREYAVQHLDVTDNPDDVKFDVYVVWSCRTLQNYKALVSTSLRDGMYYEITYNGDKDEVYLDAYKKFENRRFVNKPKEAQVETKEE